MKAIFELGERKTYNTKVVHEDIAAFHGETVHNVLSTFAIGRDAEWVCRLFVLEMKDDEEEGIGVSLTINHVSPAKLGAEVTFTATLTQVIGNKIVCIWEANVQGRLIANGEQVQKIVSKEKLKKVFANL